MTTRQYAIEEEPPYFDYIKEVQMDVLDAGGDDRPPSRDVVFRFPKRQGFGKHNFKVRFHGEKHNRFITTFPKPHDGSWGEITSGIDVSGVVLTAIVYLEQTYGLVTKDFSNVPSWVRT